MPHVKLKNTPHLTTEVTEGELTDLRRLGLLADEAKDEDEKTEEAAPKATRPKALISESAAEQKNK